MQKKILLSICFILTVFVFTLKSQNSLSIDFVFTANHTCSYSALDSVLVENLTQGGDTVLYWNDTVLTFSFTNISTISPDESDFWVSQNYPNPFKNQTDIDIFVNENDEFLISVYDLVGREVANYKSVLEFGMHNFTFNAGNSKSYILTIKSGKEIRHIQMVQLSQIGFAPSIVYNGVVSSNEPDNIAKSLKTVFPYYIGDELRFTCYVSGDYLSIIDSPEHGELYFFDIANSLPDQPSIISGNTIVCENTTELTYSVDIIENVDYLWSVPPEWEILSGQGTNSITVNAESSGIVSVLTTNNCGDSPERSLEVYFNNVSVSATSISGDTEICEGSEAVLNVIGGELGTDAEWFWYSGLCGENEIGTGSAITVSPIETSSYFVRAEGLCNITSCVQVTIDVNATPDATITHPGVFCNTDSPIELNSATEGGVWSGDGITDANNGIFDPAIAGEGSHIITYLVTENECTNSDQITIQVFETPDATISEQDDLCDNDSEVVLTAASTGGIWSGNGITDANNGIFDPAIAGEGSHEISYNIGVGTCADSDIITITVNATPDATITHPGVFCNTDSPVELNSATEGGVWSGDGITDVNVGTFDPAIAGEGSHIITYLVTENECTNSDQITIQVFETPDATISEQDDLCDNDSEVVLTAASTGGIWSGNGITDANNGIFDPAIAGEGSHIITYQVTENECTNSDQITIQVFDTPDATITQPGEFCNTDSPFELIAATDGGIWSGDGITDPNAGTFDPSIAGEGSHIVTYNVNIGICSDYDNITINVNSIPQSPIIGSHVISETQIVWNWNTSSGANGYKYNTENNYETATNNGNNNSYTQEGLDCNTEYTLYVWAYNDCGSSSTLVMTAETEDCSSEFICGEDFTDNRDDQSYTTLQIGDQCWMTENLAYLPVVHDNLQFYNAGDNSQPGFGVYDYDGSDTNEAIATSSYNDFGVLYNWWAAMDGSTSSDTNPSGIQGICPDGWHLPSDAEWKQLEMHLGMTQEQADDTGWRGTNEGSKLAGGYDFWANGNLRNNAEFDSSGFLALPGGNRSSYGVYNLMSSNGNWWSSTETTATKAWRRNINNDDSSVVRFDNVKKNGYSIRCLR